MRHQITLALCNVVQFDERIERENVLCREHVHTSALQFRLKIQHTLQRMCKILAARRAQWEKKETAAQKLFFIQFNYTES